MSKKREDDLREQLETASQLLAFLEKQAAGHTDLTRPASLELELKRKREEVASLEVRLAQLTGHCDTVPICLPRRSSIFVGREAEINQCLEAIDPQVRGWGVTIDGIGGIGKTGLAAEVAWRASEKGCFDAYLFATAKTTWLTPEGVRQETLSLSSLDAFIREFARLLGNESIIQITDSKQRRAALLDALRGRRTLFIFDNLETLTAEERILIAEFLNKLPEPNKAIITSRYRTGDGAITVRLDRLSEEDALKLMTETGRRQARVLDALNHSDTDTKHKIYEAVGGSPLALTWLLGLVAQRGYSLAEALERLRNTQKSQDLYTFLFTDAVRDLDENDRSLLSALSVFQTPASINALADATGLSSEEVGMSLARLVTLSLVSDLEYNGYGLHPLTRNYVRAALGSGSEVDRVALEDVVLDAVARRRALRYWLDYAVQHGGDSSTAYQNFNYLEREWANLEANIIALRDLSGIPGTLKDQEAARMLIELSDALRNFLWCRGYWDERILLNEWAYQAAQSLFFWRDAGWAAYSVAWIYINRAETDRAVIWADRAAEAMARGGDRHDQSVAKHLRGRIAYDQRNFIEAKRLYTEVLAIYREMNEETDEAIVLNDLGVVVVELQDDKQAQDYYTQALKIHEKRGETVYQPAIFGNLGDLSLKCGDLIEARKNYDYQLNLAKKINRQDLVTNAQVGLACVLEQQGAYREALNLGEEAQKTSLRLRQRNLKKVNQLIARLRKKLSL